MKRVLKILMLEDDPTDAEIIRRQLQKEMDNCRFMLATDKKNFIQGLDEFYPDVIISDNSLPQFDATEALSITRQRHPHLPFILVTGTVSEEFAANIIRLGADDYILKDRLIRLPSAIRAALEKKQTEKEFSDYKFALDESADVTITDQRGVIIYANPNFCKISKYAAEELVGQDHRLVNSGHHPPSFIRDLWVTIANGGIWHGEFRNKAKDGSYYWQDTTVVPFLDAKGKPYQYLAIRKDITKRKKAEMRLMQAQKGLRQAQEIAHLGNWELNFASNRSKWSDEAYRIYGLEPGDHNMSIDDWMAFIHPDDLDYVREQIERSGQTRENTSFFHRIKRKDGSIRYVYSESRFELDDTGQPIGLYGIVHDVTESKKAEEELRKSHERFKYATRATADIIWELNFENKEYIIHEGGDSLFEKGVVLDWDFGTVGDYVFEEDRERVRSGFAAARKDPGRELWEEEYRVWSAERKLLNIINRAIFIRDKTGKALRAIGAITDISDIKKLEAELREQQKQEQLRITATALEAQEKERNAIGQELHDNVNQILVGTKMLLSMFKSNTEKAAELVSTAIDNLQLAINENRKIAHVFVAPDLESESLEQQLRTLVVNMLEANGIRAHVDFSAFREQLLDKQKKINIYRIAQEQCTNIVKYARAHTARITLATSNGTFRMIISDDGVGMETGKKITGIGIRNITGRLSIFNGRADIETAPGKGFKLHVVIPLQK